MHGARGLRGRRAEGRHDPDSAEIALECYAEFSSRDVLDDVELAVVMIDGIELAGMTHVVALRITPDRIKLPLSLREGSTGNARP